MIIGVDANEANVTKRVGVSIYTYNLLKYFLRQANKNLQFKIFLKHPSLHDLPKKNKYFQYEYIPGSFLWSQVFLPFRLYQKKDVDVFFSPAHYLPRFCPAPAVVTIHDLAYLYFEKDFLKKDLYQLKKWTRYSVDRAAKIIAVSKTTKKDLIKSYGIPEDKIEVVYNGVESQKSKVKNQNYKSKFKNIKPYILFVGTLQPRKNLPILIDAFNEFLKTNKNFKLIIVGKKGWLYESIFQKVKEMRLGKKVIFTNHVSDEQLFWYYKNAFCLVMPSLYEGFGLPVLEAMRYNCPTIISYASSLPEVGGDASLYFDPKNPLELTEKLLSLQKNDLLRKELITKGRQQLKKFSWEKCGRQTLEVLKNVYDKNH